MKVKDSRCGSCQKFAEHTCIRNDFYLKPDAEVAEDFAVKCDSFSELSGK